MIHLDIINYMINYSFNHYYYSYLNYPPSSYSYIYINLEYYPMYKYNN